MKALSVKQPWAWLLIRPDVTNPEQRKFLYRSGLIKDCENRSSNIGYYRDVVIVSSLNPVTNRDMQTIREAVGREHGILIPLNLPLGVTMGRVTFKHPVTHMSSPFFVGPVAYPVEDSEPLPMIPVKGRLGFYDLPESVVTKLRAAQTRAAISSKPGYWLCYYNWSLRNGKLKQGVTVIEGNNREAAISNFRRSNSHVKIEKVTP